MKTIKSMLAVGLLTLSFAGAGCGDSADTSKLEKAIDAMCACTTEECMDQASKDRREGMKAITSKFKSEKDAPKDLVEKVGKLDDKWRECRDKAREASKGAAPAE